MKGYNKQSVCSLWLCLFVWGKTIHLCPRNFHNNFNKVQQKTSHTSDDHSFHRNGNPAHAVHTFVRSFFKQEKGVKWFCNLSERVEEEISKSGSQSFTLVSMLASVNAQVYYLAGSLSLFPWVFRYHVNLQMCWESLLVSLCWLSDRPVCAQQV